MGTRGLYQVIKNKEIKVSQYGQWDAYPEGQGLTVLGFCRKVNMSDFSKRVDGLHSVTELEVSEMIRDVTLKEGKDFISITDSELVKAEYPQLSRDTCADIYDLILNGTVINVFVDENYGGIEWTYTIDLDRRELIVGVGADKVYSFDDLPTDEDFCKELDYLYNANE